MENVPHLYFATNGSVKEQSASWEANNRSASQEILHF